LPQQEQRKKLPNPEPGILQKIFGSNEFGPNVWEAIRIAKQEAPDLDESNIKPYGMFSRLLQPNAQAYASPGRSIYLNDIQDSPEGIASTLLHEHEHVRQMNQRNKSFLGELYHEATSSNEPYHRRPDEMAAYDVEKKRALRKGFQQPATPLFDTGKMRMPTDVYLKPERKK